MPIVNESLFVTPRGWVAPAINNFITLAANGKQTFGGKADNQTLYSEQNTKGLTTATVEITNYLTKVRTAELYKQETNSSGNVVHTRVATFSPAANSTMGWGVNSLNSNTCYYMKFPAPSDFVGFIQKR